MTGRRQDLADASVRAEELVKMALTKDVVGTRRFLDTVDDAFRFGGHPASALGLALVAMCERFWTDLCEAKGQDPLEHFERFSANATLERLQNELDSSADQTRTSEDSDE